MKMHFLLFLYNRENEKYYFALYNANLRKKVFILGPPTNFLKIDAHNLKDNFSRLWEKREF